MPMKHIPVDKIVHVEVEPRHLGRSETSRGRLSTCRAGRGLGWVAGQKPVIGASQTSVLELYCKGLTLTGLHFLTQGKIR